MTLTPRLRSALAAVALIPILWFGWNRLEHYFTYEHFPRPHDFLQVWSAGTLVVNGDNPYDAKKMWDLQRSNRCATVFASMMWVPPWGLVVTVPLGLLPIDVAQVLWVFGQAALVLWLVTVLWKAYGGSPDRRWLAVALAVGFGPLWWQVLYGQYAGLMLMGLTGYLVAHRANRPVLAGACLFFVALKPHLFPLLAIGMLIDGVRTPFGRKVVLGGALVLVAAAAVVTALCPSCWEWYRATAGQGYTEYSPGLSQWFPPTIHGQIRYWLPGHPFWFQFIPIALIAPAFAVYWWRRGNPNRWPEVLLWLVPLQLLAAPYGSWPSDWTLLLVPLMALAVRLDAAGWNFPRRKLVGVLYVAGCLTVMILPRFDPDLIWYTWVLPTFAACMYWVHRNVKPVAVEPQPVPALAAETLTDFAMPPGKGESVPTGAAF